MTFLVYTEYNYCIYKVYILYIHSTEQTYSEYILYILHRELIIFELYLTFRRPTNGRKNSFSIFKKKMFSIFVFNFFSFSGFRGPPAHTRYMHCMHDLKYFDVRTKIFVYTIYEVYHVNILTKIF